MPFDGSRYPTPRTLSPIEEGGNCQRYAYEVLAQFGYRIGDLRSSQLWADTHTTSHVRADGLTPLDLVLFNATADAYGG